MWRALVLPALLSFLVGLPAFSQQRSSQFVKTQPTGSISGKVTVQMTVGRTVGEYPVANLSLYLLRVEDGKALHDLQRKCRQALARTSSDPGATYDLCTQSQAEAARLVPQLAVAATSQTGRDGQYRFSAVQAGGQYQIVGLRYDGEEPTLVVALTRKIKAGEDINLNLSENGDWTEAVPSSR